MHPSNTLKTEPEIETGHARQNPSVKSKKKPHSEEEEKEDEEEKEKEKEKEEEEERRRTQLQPTALDGNEVSHENVDIDTCDHSKQGLESEIAPETKHDPESEVTDVCVCVNLSSG